MKGNASGSLTLTCTKGKKRNRSTAEDDEFRVEDAFPAGSSMMRNHHPTMNDQELIRRMRDAHKQQTKTKLQEIDDKVWDRKGNLKKYEYLMQLPNTKRPEDLMTTAEKQAYINGTPKSRRDKELSTLLNPKGGIRQRQRPAYIQPRKEGTTLMESPVYAPKDVLPSPANYAKHLELATMAEPLARNLRASRLSAARKEVALGQPDVIAKQARLQEAEERIRKEHAKVARDLT